MGIQGRPRERRINYLIKALYFVPIPIVLGIYLAKFFPISNIVENFDSINWLEGVFHPEINQYTYGVSMLLLLVYVVIVWQLYTPDNRRSYEEYGSARWGKWNVLVNKYSVKENQEYQNSLKHIRKRLIKRSSPNAIPDMQPVSSTNRIMSEHVKFDINVRTSNMNANSVGIGSAGSKKTTTLVYTNIMQNGGSMVVCDPKITIFLILNPRKSF